MKIFVDQDNGIADPTVTELEKNFEIVDSLEEAERVIAFKHPLVAANYELTDEQKLIYVAPIDAYPLDDRIKPIGADTIVPMTNFGAKALVDAEFENIAEPIPFSFDSDLFKPFAPEEYEEYNAEYELEDATVVGYSGPQNSRTNMMTLLFGFKEFVESGKEDNPVLLLNTQVNGPGADFSLLSLVELMDLGDKVMLIDGPASADIFNMMDVFVTTNCADMFNIPVMRAQACGIPCVVTNYGGQVELVKGNGVLLEIEVLETMTNGTAWAYTSKESTALGIQMALDDRDTLSENGVEAMKVYTHENVQPRWTKLMETL